MRHVRLGYTGLSACRLCLGTTTFGLPRDESTDHVDPYRRGDDPR